MKKISKKQKTIKQTNKQKTQQGQEHKQQKPRLLGIIRSQFFHHSDPWIPQHTRKAKLSITIDGENRIVHDKIKFTHFISINAALQRIIDGKHQHKVGNYTLEKRKESIFQQIQKKIDTQTYLHF